MKKQLIVNSLTGVVQSIVVAILIFTVIPVFIKLLGVKEYGIFSTIMIIGNLNTFINLGLTTTLVKYLAEQGKNEESNYDIIVTLILTAGMLLPLTLLAIGLNEFIILKILNLPAENIHSVKSLYIFMLISNSFLFLGQVFKAVLDSVQKIDLNNYLQIFYNLVYWSVLLTVLLLGYGLGELGIAFLISSLLWFGVTLYYCLKYWGRMYFNGLTKHFTRIALKQISYGSKIYISGLVSFFYEPFSKILISQYFGVSEVGFFDIALRIRSQLWGLISKLFYPLYPLLASLKDKNKIRLYVHDLEQKTFLVIIPISVIFVLIIKPFISLWIAQNVEVISISTIAIVTAYMLGVTVVPNYQYLLAQGHADKTILLQISNVLFNTIFFFLTYRYCGYYAAVVGNVAAIVSSFILSLYYQRKYLHSIIFDSWSQVLILVFMTALLFAIGFVTNIFIVSNLWRILIDPLVISAVSLLFYRKYKLLSKEDILRYAGNNARLAHLGNKVFIRDENYL